MGQAASIGVAGDGQYVAGRGWAGYAPGGDGDGDAPMDSAMSSAGVGDGGGGSAGAFGGEERGGGDEDGAYHGEPGRGDTPMDSAVSGPRSRGSAAMSASGPDGHGGDGPGAEGRSSGSSPSRAGAGSSVGSGQSGGEAGAVQAAIDEYGGVPGVYRIVKRIGRGAYGYVYSARIRSGEKVAVKHIAGAFLNDAEARKILRELKVMQHFNHPNIIKLKGVLRPREGSDFTSIYVATELMETDLHRVVHSDQDLSSDHIAFFVYQTLCGLRHLHAASVLHRDLKPSNLLVNSDCTVRLCDFGLAREQSSFQREMTTYVVTRWYRAPELLLVAGRYSSAIDVWSVGYMHQLELITDLLGTPGEGELHFITNARAREYMLAMPRKAPRDFGERFPHSSPSVRDLLRRMLRFDPATRMSVDEALSHSFFARVRPPAGPARAALEALPTRMFDFGFDLKTLSVVDIKTIFLRDVCPPAHPPLSPEVLLAQYTAFMAALASGAAPAIPALDERTAAQYTAALQQLMAAPDAARSQEVMLRQLQAMVAAAAAAGAAARGGAAAGGGGVAPPPRGPAPSRPAVHHRNALSAREDDGDDGAPIVRGGGGGRGGSSSGGGGPAPAYYSHRDSDGVHEADARGGGARGHAHARTKPLPQFGGAGGGARGARCRSLDGNDSTGAGMEVAAAAAGAVAAVARAAPAALAPARGAGSAAVASPGAARRARARADLRLDRSALYDGTVSDGEDRAAAAVAAATAAAAREGKDDSGDEGSRGDDVSDEDEYMDARDHEDV